MRQNGETVSNDATRTNGPTMVATSEKKTEGASPPKATVATSAQHPTIQTTPNASMTFSGVSHNIYQ